MPAIEPYRLSIPQDRLDHVPHLAVRIRAGLLSGATPIKGVKLLSRPTTAILWATAVMAISNRRVSGASHRVAGKD